ncbi:hypothetical protein LF95_14595 [Thalassospira sp. TSL5-1]|nr:hypothetical protein LF95_14595 [Thalassospira sp. TSL5-1]
MSETVRKAGFGARHGRAACIVFIDQSLANIDAIIWRYAGIAEIFMIGTAQDGIALMGKVLTQRENIQTVHVFARACHDGMVLGASMLDVACLRRQSEQFRRWRDGLANDAFFFFHGCAVTDLAFDQVLAATLEAFTGALVNVGKDRPRMMRASSLAEINETRETADYSDPLSRSERRTGMDRRVTERRRG